ncbi:MAG: putative colanic acid biosynthesis acetyltransferase [Prevotella sp.]|nr:putative colanic acid biosynthesis acetyltransferase [Prevotella sp.]
MNIERKAPGHVPLSVKVKRAIWNVTATLFFRPFITGLFRLWRIALLKIFGAKVAWDANVYASAKIWAPWRLQMGHRACLGPNVICYNQDWVVFEDDAIVSQYSYLCTASHDAKKQNTAKNSLIIAPIVLGKSSWVGSRAFIGLGVHVGDNAIVGATASVFKNVDANTIVGGNPAKFLRNRILI